MPTAWSLGRERSLDVAVEMGNRELNPAVTGCEDHAFTDQPIPKRGNLCRRLACGGRDFAGAVRSGTERRQGAHIRNLGGWDTGNPGRKERRVECVASVRRSAFDVSRRNRLIRRRIPRVVRPRLHEERESVRVMLESYTTLAFLAGRTESVSLGTLVTGISYRNPAHLGKIIGTLDVLSGGRAICGLGIGWFEKEATAYGWDWSPVSQRYDLLEDSVQILRALWGKGAPAYEGKVHSVPEALSYPRPIQERIPILIGGGGEKKTLRLVAKHADWCNLMGDPETIKHKLGVLADHCHDLDRDPNSIRTSILANLLVGADRAAVDQIVEQLRPETRTAEDFAREHHAGTVDDHIGRFREYAEAGVETVIVGMPDLGTGIGIEVFGEVISAFS